MSSPVQAPRSRRHSVLRLLLAIFIVGFLSVVVTAGIATASLYRAGSIAVQVEDVEGSDFSMRVPAGLADLALTFVPASVLRDIADEMEPVWPVARASYDGIAEAPDFVIVEYNDGDEHVRVEKRAHSLVVHVDSDEEKIHVELPLRLVERILNKLERA